MKEQIEMKIRADSNNGFLQRFLLIAIVCMGFGLYCLYDGFIGYPKKLKISEAYDQFHPVTAEEVSTDQAVQAEAEWESFAQSQGWSIEKPKKRPAAIRSDIIWQYIMAGVAFLVGLPVLYNYLTSKNAWIESDGRQVTTSWGQVVDFDQVQGIDKKRWEKKGIAKVSYLGRQGEGTLVIDDFKFNRSAMGEILDQIESSLDREKIVGAPTQQELAAYEQESAEEGSQEETDEDLQDTDET
ncbi:MAG: hypothetical protein MK108_11350 [Mariniblastus sp.]|nr:hypothetical protein [Mariniblastus sp.]